MKIAIVGTAQSSRLLAPYDDQSWEIWTISANINTVPRITRFFELHDPQCIVSDIPQYEGYIANMAKFGQALVLGHEWDKLPDAYIYPIDEIVAEFGRYFTSSIALMIALAIKTGATEIGVWGVDMLGTEEYQYQRPCCEYYLGIATGRGIKVTVAKESPLIFPTRIYGIETKGIAVELVERKSEIEKELSEIDEKLQHRERLLGRLEMLNALARRWG